MSGEKNILVLFAHPALQKSRVNRHLIQSVRELDRVRIHDLYEEYPDFQIDVPREQELLRAHDLVVFHHPFYWYSSPALLKEWIDLVLQYGFAYGSRGLELQGKGFMNAITTGGGVQAYGRDGLNHFTVREFLAPFEQTAKLCHMQYLPPFVVQGTHLLQHDNIQRYADDYRELMLALRDGALDMDQFMKLEFANEDLPELRAEKPT